MFSTQRSASIRESRMGLPCSLVSSCATSSSPARTDRAAPSSTCARFVGASLLQVLKAAAAASIAPRVSSASARGTVSTTAPVAGLRTSIVAPLAASTCSPLMNIFTSAGYLGDMSETAAGQAAVSVSREAEGVALIHLNRPPANSYDRAFLDGLNAAIDEVRWDDTCHGAVLVSDLAP